MVVTNKVTGEVKTQSIKMVARITQNRNIVMYYGAATYYSVKVFDDYGNVAKGVYVTFNLNGRNYNVKTNNNGVASLKISLQPKTYIITATYKGVKVSNRIVVKPTLILANKVVKRSATFKYAVKLLNTNGKILKYKWITVKFAGKNYKARTNAYGIATFSIKAMSKIGKYTLTAIYGSEKISKVVTVR